MTYTELTERWGAGVRERRTQSGVSLERLAEMAGIGPGHLSKFERGLAGIGDAGRMRLAHALGARVEDLFPYPDGDAQWPNAANAAGGGASRPSATTQATPRSRTRRASPRAARSATAAAPSADSDAPTGREGSHE